MIDEIMVSIICNTYNHEKYIGKALESFVTQKTDFKFEVLVHDDASTDKTADIIREYEKKYPDIIKPIYQTENQYSKKLGIIGRLQAARARGKYSAFCEGDDFWTNPLKLQKQVDALEKNLSCHFCVCGTEFTYEDGTLTGKSIPKIHIDEGVINSHRFIEIVRGYNFQTSSFFARTSCLKYYYEFPPEFKNVADVGDEPLLLYFGHLGNVYYINEKMSCYRTNSTSSWSRNVRNKRDEALLHNEKMVRMYVEFDKFSEYAYHDIMQSRIDMTRYNTEIVKGNFKEVYKKENRKYYKRLPLKEKIRISILATVPFLYPMIYKLYKILRKK